MQASYPTYFESFDYQKMLQEYPLGDALNQHFQQMSREELRELQNQRFLRVVERAWQIPFYQRIWSQAGVTPDMIKSLDDIEKLPLISKSDIMDSVEKYPPFG